MTLTSVARGSPHVQRKAGAPTQRCVRASEHQTRLLGILYMLAAILPRQIVASVYGGSWARLHMGPDRAVFKLECGDANRSKDEIRRGRIPPPHV